MHWHWDVPLFELAISIPPYLAWFSFNPLYNNRDGPALCWPLYPAFLLLLSLTTPPIAPQAGQAPQGPSSFLFDSPFIIFSFLILLPSSFSLSSSSLLLFSSPLLLLFFPLLSSSFFPFSFHTLPPPPPRRSIEKPPNILYLFSGARARVSDGSAAVQTLACCPVQIFIGACHHWSRGGLEPVPRWSKRTKNGRSASQTRLCMSPPG